MQIYLMLQVLEGPLLLMAAGADTDIVEGGELEKIIAREAREIFSTTPTKRPRSSTSGSRKASF